MYLIRFRYEHYCQGYEWVTETVLVKLPSYMSSTTHNLWAEACKRIESKYLSAKDFENLTME